MTVRGVDDQAVDAGVEQLGRLGADVAVDSDGGGDPQTATRVDGGLVERGAQGAGAGQDAEQPAVAVDGHRERRARRVELVEGDPRVGVGVDHHLGRSHHLTRLGEPVDVTAVGLGDHTDRATGLDHHGRAVRPLGDQRQGLGDGLVGAQHDGGVEDEVA